MTAKRQIKINIDLRGMTARTQQLLRQAMSHVAIGLNARQGISDASLTIPDLTIRHQFDASNKWTVEQAQTSWKTWILRNGFRDVSEALSGVLEEAQQILSFWQISILQDKRQLLGEDWNSMFLNRSKQFHRLGLPHKLDFLNKKYNFELDPDLVSEALSINAARNCLVHRGGVVTELDTDASGFLVLKWRTFALVAIIDGEEHVITPPHHIEADTEIGITTRMCTKSFEVGQLLHVSTQVERMKEAGYDVGDTSYESIKEFHDSKRYNLIVPRERHIAIELKGIDVILPLLDDRGWHLIFRDTRSSPFITSDHPVALFWNDPGSIPRFFRYSPGYGMKGTTVYFPLSQDCALIGQFEERDSVTRIDEVYIAHTNAMMLYQSQTQVYAPKLNFKFVGNEGPLLTGKDLLKKLSEGSGYTVNG